MQGAFLILRGTVHQTWATRQAFDDKIYLFGRSVPYIFCNAGKHRFSVVGECFIHSIMDGEAFATAYAADYLDVILI